MLDEMIRIEESELPPLDDPKMQEYGYELGREFMAFSRPRISLETELWPASIRAFMCIRDDLPFIPSMKFVDNGMLGEPDVRIAIKQARDSLMSACLPTDEGWLEPASLNDQDDDGSLEIVKNFLISKFESACVRDTFQIFLDQLLSIGTSAVGIRWEKLYTVQRMNPDLARSLKDIAQLLQVTDDDGNPLGKKRGPVKYWKKIFDGPLTYPIDMYRLWLDPNMDASGKDRDMSFIYLTFKTMADLKGAVDPETGENLYDHKALENVSEWTYQQYYALNKYACEAQKLMGINSILEDMHKFVPVYMFYRQVREFEDKEKYVDKYFYVARSGQGREWTVIRVQDNPSTFGIKPFYWTSVDPWVGTPYGASLVEKALSVWKAKNILEAIGLNAKVLALFPPNYFVGGVLKDDRKPRFMPGGNQEIIMRPGVGLEWIKPFPINPENVMLGMQDSRYYAEKILSATGVQTASLMADPSRSMSKEKTATEVRQSTVEGVQNQQVLVDRINENVTEPLANAMHDLCRQHYTDDQKFISQDQQGKPTAQRIAPEVIDRDREIKIVGRRALANKANMVNNMLEALKILANPQAAQVIPNLPLMLQDVIFKTIAQLGVPIKPEYRATPEEIFAKEPQVMIAAVKNALQNPEMRQQVGQMLLASPEGQNFLVQMKQQFAQGQAQRQQQQQPQQNNGGEAA